MDQRRCRVLQNPHPMHCHDQGHECDWPAARKAWCWLKVSGLNKMWGYWKLSFQARVWNEKYLSWIYTKPWICFHACLAVSMLLRRTDVYVQSPSGLSHVLFEVPRLIDTHDEHNTPRVAKRAAALVALKTSMIANLARKAWDPIIFWPHGENKILQSFEMKYSILSNPRPALPSRSMDFEPRRLNSPASYKISMHRHWYPRSSPARLMRAFPANRSKRSSSWCMNGGCGIHQEARSTQATKASQVGKWVEEGHGKLMEIDIFLCGLSLVISKFHWHAPSMPQVGLVGERQAPHHEPWRNTSIGNTLTIPTKMLPTGSNFEPALQH